VPAQRRKSVYIGKPGGGQSADGAQNEGSERKVESGAFLAAKDAPRAAAIMGHTHHYTFCRPIVLFLAATAAAAAWSRAF